MGVVVTLNIPDAVAHQAQVVAYSTQRRVEDVLTEWLDRAASETPVDQLPDSEVLAAAEMQLPKSQQQELSDLLADQRESQLNEAGRTRLDTLMEIYQQGMVRKAQAIKVAVERGLMPPLG
jgi:hypothetical protein